MNCTVGLAYGMAQIGYLGSQGVKYAYAITKFNIGKVFNLKNITVPANFLCKLILGFDFSKKNDVM